MSHDESISKANEKNNVYANNIKHKPIHISEAESGRKGYFCLGCDREMQGVISKKQNRISYFRHDPKAVKGKGKCTYSDETYRHELAKEILQRIKFIKVPSLYKYPSKGQEGKACFIADSMLIEATKVENEMPFYENENGIICWGKNLDVNKRNLLFTPDVAFFDTNHKPILLIEIIATHGINADKLVKIKRIGIDTVQVTVPKSSPDEIEKTFSITNRTKWIYNYEQEITEYVQVPDRDSTSVLFIDELQRNLFEETFTCRASEIANLIRSFKRCLESKSYRDTERSIRSELHRIESNTTTNREQLQRLQDKSRKEIEGRFKGRRELFEDEEGRFQKRFDNLEERYLRKRREYLEKGEILDTKIKREIEKIGGNSKSFETRRREITEETERIELDIEREQQRRKLLYEKGERIILLTEEENRKIDSIAKEEEHLPAEFEKIDRAIRNRFIRSKEKEEKRITEIPITFERDRKELEQKIENLRIESNKSIKKRNVGGSKEFSEDLKKLLKNGALLNNFPKVYNARDRNRKAWEAFKSGVYKKWNR